MNDFPDVIGRRLEAALAAFRERGVEPRVVRTRAPRGTAGERWRVVRVRVAGGAPELTVAAEAISVEDVLDAGTGRG